MLRDHENISKLKEVCEGIINNNIVFVGHKVPEDYIIKLIEEYKKDCKDYFLKKVNDSAEFLNVIDCPLKENVLYVSLNCSSYNNFKEITKDINDKQFCEKFKYMISIGKFIDDKNKILSIYKVELKNDILELESILEYNMQTSTYQ